MLGHSAVALAILPEIAVIVKEHLNSQSQKQPLTQAEKDVLRVCTAAATCGVALLVTSDMFGLILGMPVVVDYLNRILPGGHMRELAAWLKHPQLMLMTQIVALWLTGAVAPKP